MVEFEMTSDVTLSLFFQKYKPPFYLPSLNNENSVILNADYRISLTKRINLFEFICWKLFLSKLKIVTFMNEDSNSNAAQFRQQMHQFNYM